MKPVILTILISVFAISVSHAQFAGGSGTVEDPYQIETVDQLQEIRNHLDRHFIQIADIDASDTQNWFFGQGFNPIGNESEPFVGSFNGNGFEINSLFISRTTLDNGLFGYVGNAVLENITVADLNYSGHNHIGGLVGRADGDQTIIHNSTTSGKITASGWRVGGLVGKLRGGAKITKSSSSVTILSEHRFIGGLVGASFYSHIENSFATGNINGFSEVGGLVGSASGLIIGSYASGNVIANARRAGGLVGWLLGIVEDSYSLGNSFGLDAVGGLAGATDTHSKISQSYSVGEGSAAGYFGGLIGVNNSQIENCYWDAESSGVSNAVGLGDKNGIVGLTTQEMTGVESLYNMHGFNFQSNWFLTEAYPAISWENREAIPLPAPSEPIITLPNNHQIVTSGVVSLHWKEKTPLYPKTFTIEVTTDENFSSVETSKTTSRDSVTIDNLNNQTMYLWRVKGQNDYGPGPFSDPRSFYITENFLYSSGKIISGVSKYSNDIFFTSSMDDRVYCFNRNGDILWMLETGGEIQSTVSVDQNGNSFVGSTDTRLYSFDKDGIPRWDRALGGTILSSPSIGDDDLVYVGISTGRFIAVSKDDGNVAWSIQTGDQILSSASVDNDGNVFFGSNDGKLYAVDNSGELLWTYETEGAVTGSPALTMGGEIVFPSEDGRLYKLDGSGNLLWSYETEGAISSSPVIRSDGVIVFGSGDGKVYAISEEGSLAWSYDAGSPVNGTAALTQDGLVVIGADDGRILVLSQSGDLLRQLRTGGAILAPVLINQDNSIHVSSTDGYVYILENLVPENHSKQLANADQPVHPWGTFKGNNRRTGNQADIVERIDERDPGSGELPEAFELQQNFPNPFNPSTRIRYAVTEQAHVRLSVYNSLGQHVSTLVNGNRSPGWYNVTFDASGLSSGLYMYRLEANGFVETRKMMFVK